MPYFRVHTNVKRSSVDVDSVLQACNKTIADALGIPHIYVMAHVAFDQDMQLANTKEPCAFVNVRLKGNVSAEKNPKTVAAITDVMKTTLGIRADHVFINLNDVIGDNWGYDGKVIPN